MMAEIETKCMNYLQRTWNSVVRCKSDSISERLMEQFDGSRRLAEEITGKKFDVNCEDKVYIVE